MLARRVRSFHAKTKCQGQGGVTALAGSESLGTAGAWGHGTENCNGGNSSGSGEPGGSMLPPGARAYVAAAGPEKPP